MGKGTSLHYCDRSDIGRRRSTNQDAKAVLPPSSPQQYRARGWLFLVADGMGAHAAGEMASGIAAERVPLVYEKMAAQSPPLALRRSIEQINGEINIKGASAAEFKGMGTTCTVLALLPRGALVGHVGDSRAYRVRGRTIEQLSRDHSLVWELESDGGLSREQAAGAAPKNIITRSMGPHSRVDVDLEGPHPVEDGDTFVLCSDGLSGQASDEEIGLLAGELEPTQAAAALVGLALVRGAPDNVTVIVARAGPEEVSSVSPADESWPLTEEPAPPPDAASRPWKWLGVAAASLFAGLVAAGRLTDAENAPPAAGTLQAVCFVVVCAAALAFIGSLLAAFLGFLAPPVAGGRVLPPGRHVGKGPYRSYDCTPTDALLERIVGSLETAADGLPDPGRERMTTILARVRRHVSEQAYHEAVVAAVEAIDLFTRAVEDARAGSGPGDGSGGEPPA